ncbi:MAG: hypothetical protein JWN37_807 [Candidatus Nomurabacteria bacterium]|nr:hypothetical protein [Candidatus Nomurabacteria bacterium]
MNNGKAIFVLQSKAPMLDMGDLSLVLSSISKPALVKALVDQVEKGGSYLAFKNFGQRIHSFVDTIYPPNEENYSSDEMRASRCLEKLLVEAHDEAEGILSEKGLAKY